MKVMGLYVWSLVVAEDDVVSAVDQVEHLGHVNVTNADHDHHLDNDDA